jgi:hypothetical protein
MLVRAGGGFFALTHLIGFAWFFGPDTGGITAVASLLTFLGMVAGALLKDAFLRHVGIRFAVSVLLLIGLTYYGHGVISELSSLDALHTSSALIQSVVFIILILLLARVNYALNA